MINFQRILEKIDPCANESIIYRYIYHQSSSLTILIIYGLRAIVRSVFLVKKINAYHMQIFLRKVKEILLDLVEINFLQEQSRLAMFRVIILLLSMWRLFINKKEIFWFYHLHASIGLLQKSLSIFFFSSF